MVQRTNSTRPVSEKTVTHEWHLVDMSTQSLGRVVTKVATLLSGKHKVSFVPYLDQGDFVVIVNAAKVEVTGKKESQKKYSYYSGYPGGLKKIAYADMKKTNPKEIVRHAVVGMLPKNKFRDSRLARLFIYAGTEHPYTSKFEK